jgi:hypothetical protein
VRAINRPVSWWGWHWSPPVPMSIVEIIRAGSLSSRLAALFWLGMERGASLIVAAEPPSAGKTTTLTALLAFTPPDTVAYFTQGVGESFAVPPLSPSHPTYILINELSDHLPVYTWGPYARRAFELLAQGYSLASTMHADRVEEVLGQLEGELAIPRAHLARLTFIVCLRVGYAGQPRRRLEEVAFLQPDAAQGYRVLPLARWRAEDDSFLLLEDGEARRAFAAWAGLEEAALEGALGERQRFLDELLAQGVTAIPAVAEAIEAFYRQRGPGG